MNNFLNWLNNHRDIYKFTGPHEFAKFKFYYSCTVYIIHHKYNPAFLNAETLQGYESEIF